MLPQFPKSLSLRITMVACRHYIVYLLLTITTKPDFSSMGDTILLYRMYVMFSVCTLCKPCWGNMLSQHSFLWMFEQTEVTYEVTITGKLVMISIHVLITQITACSWKSPSWVFNVISVDISSYFFQYDYRRQKPCSGKVEDRCKEISTKQG